MSAFPGARRLPGVLPRPRLTIGETYQERGFLGQVADAFYTETMAGAIALHGHDLWTHGEVDPNYDLFSDPLFLENPQWHRELYLARNREDLQRLVRVLQRSDPIRQRGARAGFLPSLIAQFGDPINYIPVPVGTGFALARASKGVFQAGLRGARVGVAAGIPATAVQEVFVQAGSPQRTPYEMVADFTFSTLISGLIGGVGTAGLKMLQKYGITRDGVVANAARDYEAAVADAEVPRPRPDSQEVSPAEGPPTAMADPVTGAQLRSQREVDDLVAQRRRVAQGARARGDEEGAQAFEHYADMVAAARTSVELPDDAPTPRERATFEIDFEGVQQSPERRIRTFKQQAEAKYEQLVERLTRRETKANDLVQRIDELERKIQTAKTKSVESRFNNQRDRAVVELRRARADVETARGDVLRAQSEVSDLERKTEVDASKLQASGTGLEKIAGALDLPWYQLKNTTFEDPFIAHELRDLAEEIVSSPGVRVQGTQAGYVQRQDSVESGVYQRNAEAMVVIGRVKEIFYKHVTKSSRISESELFQVGFEIQRRAREAADAAQSVMGRRREPSADREPNWHEFKAHVTSALVHGDSAGHLDLSAGTRAVVEQAAREVRGLLVRIGDEAETYGMLHSRAAVSREIDRVTRREDTLTVRVEELDRQAVFYRTAEDDAIQAQWDQLRDAYPDLADRTTGRIGDFGKFRAAQLRRVRKQRLDAELEQEQLVLQRERIEATQAAIEDQPPFDIPRFYLQGELRNNKDGIMAVLVEDFTARPYVYEPGTGKRIDLDASPEAIRERAERAYENLLQIPQLVDEVSHGVPTADLEDFERMLHQVDLQIRSKEPLKGTDPGPVATVVHDATGRFRDDGQAVEAYVRENADGTFTVTLDEKLIRQRWAQGDYESVRPEYVESADEMIRFVEEHELAHTRFRKRPHESRREYERRINAEAEEVIRTGVRSTEDLAALKLKRSKIEKLIARAHQVGPGGPSRFHARQLTTKTENLLDFLDTDIESWLPRYVTNVGGPLEVARKFGDHRMRGRLEELDTAIEDQVTALRAIGDDRAAGRMEEEWSRQRRNLEDLRDLSTGRYGLVDDPMALGPRAARFARNWSTMSFMGRAFQAALIDPMKVVMTHGIAGLGRGLFRFPTQARRMAKDEIRRAGLAWETVSGMRMNTLVGGAPDVRPVTSVEKLAEAGSNLTMVINLLGPFTDVMYQMSAMLNIDRILRAADDVTQGKGLDDRRRADMAAIGFDETRLRRLNFEWKSAGGEVIDGMYTANGATWRDEELQRYFRSALNNAVRTDVVTAGIAETPRVLRGSSTPTALGLIATQFLTFANAATHRTLISGMQQRDARFLMAVVSMIAMGAIIDWIRRPDWMELEPYDLIYRAVDKSGVFGLLLEPMNRVPDLWHESDMYTDKMAVVGGPFVKTIPAAAEAALRHDELPGSAQARAYRYAIPFNNILWWSDLATYLQRQAAEELED